jgi:transcriptional regulator GlxA family with amidase domain
MKVAYVVYPDFTALDLIGPYEVISRWPDVEVHFLASQSGPVTTDCGLTVVPTDTPETLPSPDLIVVPGSGKPLPVLEDQVLIQWLGNAAPGCQWTVSVCTGASLYAAAGLLEGKKTTTHWAFRDVVGALGAEVVEDRVVWQGNHVSGAGVSAGIDVALSLTERVHGQELAKALQLVIEYDPEPPFDSGSPAKADRQTKRLAEQVLLAGQSRLGAMARGARTIIRARRSKRRTLRDSQAPAPTAGR